jgi:alkylation response protein AidB-like acyl-CoA dehydrogenase
MTPETATPETALAAARDLAPALRKAAADNEAARRLSDETVTAMRQAGLFAILLPAAYGGAELPLPAALAVVEEVAAADGSAGWCLLKGAATNQLAGYLPAAAARRIWADPTIVTGGNLHPRGRAVEVEGGYRLTGRWDWGTGVVHSAWVVGGAVVVDAAGNPRPGPTPDLPETKAFVFPRDVTTVHDSWRAAGMRATASGEFEVRDLVVPADHVFDGMAARPVVQGVNYAVPYIAQAMVPHAAVAVGVARGALADFRELARVKVPTLGTSRLFEQDRVAEGVGRAEAMVHAARATAVAAAESVWSAARAGRRPREDELVHLSLAATYATELCVAAVDLAHSLAGGSAVDERSPLQRAFRDIHVAATHFLVRPDKYLLGGRALLGP